MKKGIVNLFIFILPSFALAEGTISANSAGAYVCHNKEGEITDARLVDLWEAENIPFQWPHKLGKLHIARTDKISEEDQFGRLRAFERNRTRKKCNFYK